MQDQYLATICPYWSLQEAAHHSLRLLIKMFSWVWTMVPSHDESRELKRWWAKLATIDAPREPKVILTDEIRDTT